MTHPTQGEEDMGPIILEEPILPPCIKRRLDLALIPKETPILPILPEGVTLHTGVDTFKLSAGLIPKTILAPTEELIPVYVIKTDRTWTQQNLHYSQIIRLSRDPHIHSITLIE